MRKLLFGLLLTTTMFVMGCIPTHATESDNFIVSEWLQHDGYILVDKITGVEYIVFYNYGGRCITPRLNTDGSLFTADQE